MFMKISNRKICSSAKNVYSKRTVYDGFLHVTRVNFACALKQQSHYTKFLIFAIFAQLPSTYFRLYGSFVFGRTTSPINKIFNTIIVTNICSEYWN